MQCSSWKEIMFTTSWGISDQASSDYFPHHTQCKEFITEKETHTCTQDHSNNSDLKNSFINVLIDKRLKEGQIAFLNDLILFRWLWSALSHTLLIHISIKEGIYIQGNLSMDSTQFCWRTIFIREGNFICDICLRIFF